MLLFQETFLIIISAENSYCYLIFVCRNRDTICENSLMNSKNVFLNVLLKCHLIYLKLHEFIFKKVVCIYIFLITLF